MKRPFKPMPKFCPVCKSVEIFPFMGFQTGCRWECKKCGYVGVIVLEQGKTKKLK